MPADARFRWPWQRWKHADPAVREAAVGRMPNLRKVRTVALHDASERVRAVAAQRAGELERALVDDILKHQDYPSASRVSLVESEEGLARIALTSWNSALQDPAVHRLTDLAVLEDVIRTVDNFPVVHSAIYRRWLLLQAAGLECSPEELTRWFGSGRYTPPEFAGAVARHARCVRSIPILNVKVTSERLNVSGPVQSTLTTTTTTYDFSERMDHFVVHARRRARDFRVRRAVKADRRAAGMHRRNVFTIDLKDYNLWIARSAWAIVERAGCMPRSGSTSSSFRPE